MNELDFDPEKDRVLNSVFLTLKRILLLSVGFLALWLSTATAGPKSGSCISEEDAQTELNRWSEFLKKSFNIQDEIPSSMIQKVQDGCWKKKLRLLDRFYLVIYKNPEVAKESVSSFLNSIRAQERPREQCIRDALRVARDLKLDWVNRILDRHRSRHAWQWKDPDLGPGQYLACPAQDTVAFFDSIVLMLHELNHLNAKEPCVYDPFADQERCLDSVASLPGAAKTKLDDFPTTVQNEKDSLELIQRTYLEAIPNVSLYSLLNELMGYSVSIQALTGILSSSGKPAVFADDGRQAALSNLLLVYVIRYIEQFKASDEATYSKMVGPKTENGKQVAALLKLGEESYQGWTKVLEAIHEPLKEFETGLWKLYETTRTKNL